MASSQSGDAFLHLTDLHFWEIVLNPFALLNKRLIGALNVTLHRRKEFLIDRSELYAKAITDVGVKDVIISGDLSSTATDDEFEMGVAFVRTLESLGLCVTVIPGNHDVYTFESVRKRRFAKHFGDWFPSEALPAVRTLDGGTSVLYVPTVCPNVLSSKGRITDEQVHKTTDALSQDTGRIVVVGHYPLLGKTYGYEAGRGRRLRNAESLREALGNSGREILYVCGHVHRFSYVEDDTFAGLSHLTTGALFRRDRRANISGEFSEIGVGSEGFRVLRHLYTDTWAATEEQRRTQ